MLAPFMVADTRAQVSCTVTATDASSSGAGACAAAVSSEAALAIWRHRVRRGHYRPLAPARLETLVRQGFEREVAHIDEAQESAPPSPERILLETFDVIELCCGPSSPLLTACSRAGLRVGPRIDIRLSAVWDVKEARVIEWVLFLI